MSRKYLCRECNEDMTEKVVKKAVEGRFMIRKLTAKMPKETEEIYVKCSKGHENLFEVPKY